MATCFQHRIRRIGLMMLAAAALLTAEFAANSALAQSSRRGSGRRSGTPRSAQGVRPGSGTRAQDVALNGYCAVCIIDMKRWVRGRPEFRAEYDGQTYYFPSAEIRDTFLENPTDYVPALGGDCVVCLARMGERIPGSVYHAAYHQDRLYLFPGEEQKQMFVENPSEYADVDLAYDGLCAVCLVEMDDEVPGKEEFMTIHNGFRYYFPGEEQLQMFLENPEKYAYDPTEDGRQQASLREDAADDLEGDLELVVVAGRSSCAGCDHEVRPLGSDELGLALETSDGRLYVIEDAHELYPEIYEERFAGLQLTVTGSVLKTEGTTAWLKPASLEVSPPRT